MLNRIERFGTVLDQAFLHRGTMRRGGERDRILDFFQLAYERENMLLPIVRLEAKTPPEAPGEKCIGVQEPRRWVEDINW
jgi:hypothetical protein